MRVLLDENIPRKLKGRFDAAHEVWTVPERGWNGLTNGELLRVAEVAFDVLVTMDRGMRHQQHLDRYDLGYILLSVPTNQFPDLAPLMLQVNATLGSIRSGDVVQIGT